MKGGIDKDFYESQADFLVQFTREQTICTIGRYERSARDATRICKQLGDLLKSEHFVVGFHIHRYHLADPADVLIPRFLVEP